MSETVNTFFAALNTINHLEKTTQMLPAIIIAKLPCKVSYPPHADFQFPEDIHNIYQSFHISQTSCG